MYIAANSASHLGYLQVQGADKSIGMRICIKTLTAADTSMLSGKHCGAARHVASHALRDTYCDIGCLPTRISNKMPVTTGEARLQLVQTTRAKPTGKRRCQQSCRETCAAAVLEVGNRIQHRTTPASR